MSLNELVSIIYLADERGIEKRGTKCYKILFIYKFIVSLQANILKNISWIISLTYKIVVVRKISLFFLLMEQFIET